MTEISNLSAAYLIDAVREDLGDVAGLFEDPQLLRFLNEGQRRLEPEVARERVSTLTWVANVTEAALPADLISITGIEPADTASTVPGRYRVHGGTMYLDQRDTTYAFTGRLYYRAHFPQISDTADSLVPPAAGDALVSFALYRAFHRVASNRSVYKRYSTLTQNGVTVAELEGIATNHLADFTDVKTLAQNLEAPSFFYED